MNILIVDDEKNAREVLAELIGLYCEGGFQLEMADGIASALQSIRKKAPDLLLLDIHLKDGSGFELLNKVQHQDIHIIFITAYDEYAIRACKVSAIDYLLKPVDPDELKEAIGKAQRRVEKDKLSDRLDAFIQNMSDEGRQVKKITLKTADTIHILNVSDIVFCKADGNYTTFHLLDRKTIVVSRPIGDYEELIGSRQFMRTHQSYLVNLDHVIRYEKGDGGHVVTVHENNIPVSTRKKEQLMQYLQNM